MTTGPALSLYIPLFYYPNWWVGSTYNWTPLINAITAYPDLTFVVEINIANGPDTAINTDYSAHGLVDLRNAANVAGTNLIILGYVFTTYGTRAAATVDTDVDGWFTFYGTQIDGIKFDEMDNVTGHEAYYTARTAHVKSKGWLGLSWGNPGTSTIASYVGTVDTLIISEADNASRPTAATMSTRTFNGAYPPKSNFAAIVFNQATLDTAYITSSIIPYCGYYWVTDDTLPNPYDSLPSYLSQLCTYLTTTTTAGPAYTWIVSGRVPEEDFPEPVEDLVRNYLTSQWAINNPALSQGPDDLKDKARFSDFDYDGDSTYHVKVKEQPTIIDSEFIEAGLFGFQTPIMIEMSARRLSKGQQFQQLNNMRLEIIRIIGQAKPDDISGIPSLLIVDPGDSPQPSNLSSPVKGQKSIWYSQVIANVIYFKHYF